MAAIYKTKVVNYLDVHSLQFANFLILLNVEQRNENHISVMPYSIISFKEIGAPEVQDNSRNVILTYSHRYIDLAITSIYLST